MNGSKYYTVTLNTIHKWYYDTLEEACNRVKLILKSYNIKTYKYTSGDIYNPFKKTSSHKIYIIDVSIPKLNIQIRYHGIEELCDELVEYYLNKD